MFACGDGFFNFLREKFYFRGGGLSIDLLRYNNNDKSSFTYSNKNFVAPANLPPLQLVPHRSLVH